MAYQAPRAFVSALVASALLCLPLPSPASAQPGSVQAGVDADELDAGNAKPAAEITFSGYQALGDGRGMVFVELTDTVAVEVSRSGQVLEYKLLGASVPLKNNKNPLLLRDFGVSALTAVLVPDKRSVRLVITLRSGAASPAHRMVSRGKGAVLEVVLPAPPAR